MTLVLFACGLALTAYGGWRGWANGRSMLGPAAHPPDELRRRALARGEPPPPSGPGLGELRHAVWRLGLAVGWLLVALLGLYMMTVASEAGL